MLSGFLISGLHIHTHIHANKRSYYSLSLLWNRGLWLNSGDLIVFKCTVRAADFCGLLGGSDKLLPHPTVVYGTSKSEGLTTSRWWHARLSRFFLWYFQTQYDYPGWAKWAFAHVPFVMRAYRAFLMVQVSHDRHLRGPCSFTC